MVNVDIEEEETGEDITSCSPNSSFFRTISGNLTKQQVSADLFDSDWSDQSFFCGIFLLFEAFLPLKTFSAFWIGEEGVWHLYFKMQAQCTLCSSFSSFLLTDWITAKNRAAAKHLLMMMMMTGYHYHRHNYHHHLPSFLLIITAQLCVA